MILQAGRRSESGFSYVMLMFAIVLIGLATSMAARQWKVIVQRELEADLLGKGIEIQNALALYSMTMKAGRVVQGEVYPASLAELTRQPKPFLRKVYLDPIGHGEWDLVRTPTGGIMGVRSKSKAKPIRERDFPMAVRHFEGRPTYSDWVFEYPNPSSASLIPGIASGTPAASGPPSAPGQPPPFSPAANPVTGLNPGVLPSTGATPPAAISP
jgi:type II secretory pathway pseudopilin PulG